MEKGFISLQTAKISRKNKFVAAFTLAELVTVLAVIGIGIGLFYSVFFVNWASLDKQTCLVDLQQEADSISDKVSFDGKLAQSLAVAADAKSVVFSFRNGVPPPITYSFLNTGQFQRTVNGVTDTISDRVDYAQSSFAKDGNSLILNLSLFDSVFGKRVNLEVSTRIIPRNSV